MDVNSSSSLPGDLSTSPNSNHIISMKIDEVVILHKRASFHAGESHKYRSVYRSVIKREREGSLSRRKIVPCFFRILNALASRYEKTRENFRHFACRSLRLLPTPTSELSIAMDGEKPLNYLSIYLINPRTLRSSEISKVRPAQSQMIRQALYKTKVDNEHRAVPNSATLYKLQSH